MLIGGTNHRGYKHVNIFQGKRYNPSIHQLVAMCFLDDWTNDLTVNHIDEVKTNNHLDNLEMLSNKDNMRYSRCKKVMRSDGKIYEGITDVKLDGFTPSIVSRCCSGILSQHKGFKWRFYYEDI